MLLRAYAVSALPILVKAIIGILLLRVLVDYLGKQGLGQVSQFQSAVLLIYGLLNAIFFNHIAKNKWTDEAVNTDIQFNKLLGLIFIFSLLISISILCTAESLSIHFFGDNRIKTALFSLAATTPLIGLFVAYSGRACADNRLTSYNLYNAIALLISTIIIYYSTLLYGQNGAFIGISMYYVFPMLFSAYVVLKNRANKKIFIPSLKKIKTYPVKSIAKVGFIGVFSALNSILLQIFMRNQLAEQSDWNIVGDWQAITKVSESYLLLATTPLTTFFLPKIVQQKTIYDRKSLINKTLLIGVLISLSTGLMVLYLWNIFIIKIIGESFSGLNELLPTQIIGDVFKVIVWTYSIVAIAKEKYTIAFISEIIYAASYIGLSFYFLPKTQLQGAFSTYLFAYFISAVYLIFSYNRYIKNEQ
jgi:PST family polysaccharide transporter